MTFTSPWANHRQKKSASLLVYQLSLFLKPNTKTHLPCSYGSKATYYPSSRHQDCLWNPTSTTTTTTPTTSRSKTKGQGPVFKSHPGLAPTSLPHSHSTTMTKPDKTVQVIISATLPWYQAQRNAHKPTLRMAPSLAE